MLLPYYAVIKDSFRAAIANWVLYILLILITVVLLMLTPFTYKEQLTTKVYPIEVQDFFAARMIAAETDSQDTPARRVWDRLSKSTKKQILELKPFVKENPTDSERVKLQRRLTKLPGPVAEDLNRIVADDTFYDAKAWKDVSLPAEFEELIEKRGSKDTPLTVEQEKRLNRIALETAMPRSIMRAAGTSLKFYYFSELFTWPMRHTDLKEIVVYWLPWVLGWFVLTIGVLVAIIGTAPILSQMFTPGSLHLLLSKPVSRSMLFLSKFLGGCIFILLCSTYLFTGVFFIMGLRLGIWQYGFLLAIPIYVFAFAIFYSVASLATIIWRNAIVAIACTFAFWLCCLMLSLAATGVFLSNQRNRIQRVAFVDSRVVCTNSDTLMWDGADFQPVLLTPPEAEIFSSRRRAGSAAGRIGVFYDKKHETLISFDKKLGLFQTAFSSRVGNRKGVAVSQIPAPSGIIYAGLDPDGSLIAVSTQVGAVRYTRNPLALSELLEGTDEEEITEEELRATIPYEVVTALDLNKSPPEVATMDQKNGDLILYSGGQLTLQRTYAAGVYQDEGKSLKLKSNGETVLLAATGETIMLARGKDEILTISTKTMKVQNKIKGEGGARPSAIVAGPSGRWFAVLYSNKQVWVYDTKAESYERADVYGAGEVGAIGFAGPHTLLVGDRTNRVIEYQLGPLEYKKTYQGKGDSFDLFTRWFVLPLYYIAPKPFEFYEPVTYMLQGEVSSIGLSSEAVRFNPYLPLWSGAWFLAFMLIICCLQIERSEY